MTSETPLSTPQECGGDVQNCGENADKGNDAGDFVPCVLKRPDPALPVVEATLVQPPRQEQPRQEQPPAPPSVSNAIEEEARQVWREGGNDAVRRYRARHRHDLFAIFFSQQPGTLDEKRQRAIDLLDRVSVTERDTLLRWLTTLTALTRSWEAS